MTSAAHQLDLLDPARLAVREATLKRSPSPEQRARRNKVRPVERNWDAEARTWMAANPEALDEFCDVALEMVRLAPDRKYLSAKHVWEECRLLRPGLKWNNNFCSAIASAAAARHSALAGRFRGRRVA